MQHVQIELISHASRQKKRTIKFKIHSNKEYAVRNIIGEANSNVRIL